jgi:hypothetical protein
MGRGGGHRVKNIPSPGEKRVIASKPNWKAHLYGNERQDELMPWQTFGGRVKKKGGGLNSFSNFPPPPPPHS